VPDTSTARRQHGIRVRLAEAVDHSRQHGHRDVARPALIESSLECFRQIWEGAAQLQREVALANVIVGFQILDGRGVDDLAFVDDGGVARYPKAEMHVLLRDQNRRTGATQLPQQLADPLHNDRHKRYYGANA